MKTNPILQEVWDIKDRLAAEAGYDADRFFEQLRAWTAAHPHPGPIVHNAEELRRLAAQPAPSDALALKEEPPRPSKTAATDGPQCD